MDVPLARPALKSWDTLLLLLAVGLALAGGYMLFTNVGTEAGMTGWILLLVGIAIAVPRTFLKLQLEPEALVVHVVTGRRRFPYEALGPARTVEGTLAVRWLGAGCSAYHTGRFHLTGQGQVKAYSTQTAGTFVILDREDGVPLALSPAEPETFLAELEQRRGAVARAR